MAGSRTLKLSILADVDDLKKKLGTGADEVEGFGSKISDFGKKAGLAFAAAGVAAAAFAGKLLIDGVKAATEDQAAQEKLALTLKNVTNATDAQIRSVEDQILKLELATGVSDDKLRPSFDRLTRATKDLEVAAKLQALALDVSAGSGKDLESVTQALAKGYEGNLTALNKLGLGISSAELKTMSFDEITKKLSDTFGGQASTQAETFQGKMSRLSVAFNEAKETVGSYVLDALTPLVSNFVDKGIPAIMSASEAIGKNLKPSFEAVSKILKEDVIPVVQSLVKFVMNDLYPTVSKILKPAIDGLTAAFDKIKQAISDNSDELQPLIKWLTALWNFAKGTLAPFLGGALKVAFEILGTAISAIVTGLGKLVQSIQWVIDKFTTLINFIKNNPLTNFLGSIAGAITGQGRGFVTDTQAAQNQFDYLNQAPANYDYSQIVARPDVIVQVMAPSVIDEEGFARAVTDALNNSYARGTGGGNALVMQAV